MVDNEKSLTSADLYRVRHTQLGDTGTVIAVGTQGDDPVSYVRWQNGTSTWLFDSYLLRLDNPNPVEEADSLPMEGTLSVTVDIPDGPNSDTVIDRVRELLDELIADGLLDPDTDIRWAVR